jgi:hypothetical protein
VSGRVCKHCRLDELFLGWEVRLFSLETRAMRGGKGVSAEDALRAAQAAAVRRVGRGGLDEESTGDNVEAEASPRVVCVSVSQRGNRKGTR